MKVDICVGRSMRRLQNDLPLFAAAEDGETEAAGRRLVQANREVFRLGDNLVAGKQTTSLIWRQAASAGRPFTMRVTSWPSVSNAIDTPTGPRA